MKLRKAEQEAPEWQAGYYNDNLLALPECP
jgi:hypothetical protein